MDFLKKDFPWRMASCAPINLPIWPKSLRAGVEHFVLVNSWCFSLYHSSFFVIWCRRPHTWANNKKEVNKMKKNNPSSIIINVTGENNTIIINETKSRKKKTGTVKALGKLVWSLFVNIFVLLKKIFTR